MELIKLEKKNNIYVVTLNDPESGNAINTDSLCAHRQILNQLEMVSEKSAVVVTSSDPKSWCVGLDFDWIVDLDLCLRLTFALFDFDFDFDF